MVAAEQIHHWLPAAHASLLVVDASGAIPPKEPTVKSALILFRKTVLVSAPKIHYPQFTKMAHMAEVCIL